MSLQAHDTRYTATAITLHWLIAAFIICAFLLGLTMVDLPISPKKLRYFNYHKWIGITILGLSSLRILWRLSHPAPALPSSMSAWQRHAATAVHILLYVLLFAIPVSGWLYSSASGYPIVYLGISALQLPDLVPKDKALASVLRETHHLLNYLLLIVFAAHVGAALKHHFIDRDETLRRILPYRAVRRRAS